MTAEPLDGVSDPINSNDVERTQEVFHSHRTTDRSNNDRQHSPESQPILDNRRKREGPVENFGYLRRNQDDIMRNIVQHSQAYSDATFISTEHVRTETYSTCTEVPATDMVLFECSDLLTPLYIEKNVDVTEKQIDQAKKLACVLRGLAQHVFKLSVETIHLYRDINGGKRMQMYLPSVLFRSCSSYRIQLQWCIIFQSSLFRTSVCPRS